MTPQRTSPSSSAEGPGPNSAMSGVRPVIGALGVYSTPTHRKIPALRGTAGKLGLANESEGDSTDVGPS